MGYSCTKNAMDTYEAVKGNMDGIGNTWTLGTNTYFCEIDKEQEDMAVTGEVFVFVGENRARKAGTFRIEPNGEMHHWDYATAAMQGATVPVIGGSCG